MKSPKTYLKRISHEIAGRKNKTIKAFRDNLKVNAAQKIKRLGKTDENLMPAIIRCVKAIVFR